MLPLPDTGSHPPCWENQLVLYGHRGFAKTSVKGFSCGPHPFTGAGSFLCACLSVHWMEILLDRQCQTLFIFPFPLLPGTGKHIVQVLPTCDSLPSDLRSPGPLRTRGVSALLCHHLSPTPPPALTCKPSVA